MKTKKIRWIIAISIISLVCLLVFQLIWLKQTQTANRILVNQSVNHALSNAVALLEKGSVYKVMHKNASKDSTRKNINISVSSTNSFYDTLLNSITVDSIVNKSRSSRKERRFTQKSEVIIIDNDTSTSNSPLKTRIDSIVGEILNDIKLDTLKTINTLNVTQVDSILKAVLLKQKISEAYEFAISNNFGNYTLKSENYDSLEEYSSYSIDFFPLSVASQKNKLHIKVVGIENYLQKALLPLALIILVLTLVIGFTFFVAIRTILGQKKLNTIKNDFINNMTHEFKTPIATISLAADALKTQPITQEQNNHFADIIKQESQSMNQKVETILQMALVEQQEIQLSKERVGASKLVENTLQHLKLKLENSEAELSTVLLEPDCVINVDTHHMGNVVSNIIDNAIKYAGGKPVINIKMIRLDDSIVINVLDKGIGMTKDEQKRVFDKFYRAESGNIHNTKGFGLGLSYASEIMKLHKGQIHIESEKGKGTSVSLTLPIKDED